MTKDASFDQRLRGQVFHNLEEELKAVLRDKNLMGDKVWVGNTGPRGVLFLGNGSRFFELGKANIAKQGEGGEGFFAPYLDSFKDFGLGEEDVQRLVDKAMKGVSMGDRRR